MPGAAGWKDVPCESLYGAYTQEERSRHPLTRQQFPVELGKLLPEPGLRRSRTKIAGGGRTRKYLVPSLDECRAEWDRQHNTETEWE